MGQLRGEAEQTAGCRREHEDQSGDGAQAVTDGELIADEAGRDAKKTDHRSDHQNDPGLRRNIGLIAGTERKKDDNPLPQSDATPDGGGITDHQGEDVPVCKDRAKVEQRLGLFLASGIPARQCRPGDQNASGTEDAGDNKSAAPTAFRPGRTGTTATRRW